MKKAKKLYRSRKDKVFAGICGGLGEYAQIDGTIVRLLFVLLLLLTGVFPFLLLYVIGIYVIPLKAA